MTKHSIKIPRQTDVVLLTHFHELAKKYSVKKFGINLGVAGSTEVQAGGKANATISKLRDLDLSLIETLSININGLSVTYYRGGQIVQNDSKSPIFDEVVFNYNANQGGLDEAERVEVLGYISTSFGEFEPGRIVPGLLTEDQQNLLAIHSSTLERLESLNIKLIQGSEEFRRDVESDYRSRTNELELDYRGRLDNLNSDIENKKKLLEQEKSELAQKLKAIDDRQNTHVRREIRKDILQEIKTRTEEFCLTRGTRGLRMPVHVACLILLVLLGVANVAYGIEFSNIIYKSGVSTLSISILATKQAFLSLAFGITAVFYIRWLNNWSSQHANAEFALKQFQLDIERASWVVETAFEWKDLKGKSIPNELLDPISRNLFTNQKEPESKLHPADELASALLGTAAKVRLQAGGSELEFDGKNLKKTSSVS
jgi:hypothetical protein